MSKKRIGFFVAIIFVFASFFAAYHLVNAAGDLTPAGTPITNNATATYDDAAGDPQPPVDSGDVTVIVGQIYDVTIDPNNTGSTTGDGLITYAHTVTNAGNGDDSFELTFLQTDPITGVGTASVILYLDENGNGVLDPGETTQISNTGLLAPGESVDIIALVDFVGVNPATDPNHGVTITATSDAVYPTGLAGGPDVNLQLPPDYMGIDTAVDTTNLRQGPALVIEKSVDVVTAVPGDTINFTLNVRNVGNGPAQAIVIDDNLDPTSLGVAQLPYDVSGPVVPGDILNILPAGTTVDVTNWPIIRFTLPAGSDTLLANQDLEISYSINLVDPLDPSTTSTSAFNQGLVAGYEDTGGNTILDPDDPDDDEASNITETTITVTIPGVIANPDGAQTVQPGDVVSYPFTVENTGTVTDNYNIVLPPGDPTNPLNYIVFEDTNGNGRLDPGEPIIADTDGDGNPNTGPLDPGETFDVVIVASVPTDAGDLPDGNDDIVYGWVESTIPGEVPTTFDGNGQPTNGTADNITFTTTIENIPGIDIQSDRVENVNPGDTVTLRHVVTNTGTGTEGIEVELVSQEGFPYTLWIDDGDGILNTALDTQLFPTSPGVFNITGATELDPGDSIQLLANVQVPPNTTVPTTEILDITATAVTLDYNPLDPADQPSDSNRDTINIVDGPVVDLDKTATVYDVSGALIAGATSARPGEYIRFEIPFVNNGSSLAENIVITDLIPADSSYVAGTIGSVVAAAVAYDNGFTPTTSTITFDRNNNAIYGQNPADIPVPGTDGIDSLVNGLRLTISNLPQGESGTLVFFVQVDDGTPDL